MFSTKLLSTRMILIRRFLLRCGECPSALYTEYLSAAYGECPSTSTVWSVHRDGLKAEQQEA